MESRRHRNTFLQEESPSFLAENKNLETVASPWKKKESIFLLVSELLFRDGEQRGPTNPLD